MKGHVGTDPSIDNALATPPSMCTGIKDGKPHPGMQQRDGTAYEFRYRCRYVEMHARNACKLRAVFEGAVCLKYGLHCWQLYVIALGFTQPRSASMHGSLWKDKQESLK